MAETIIMTTKALERSDVLKRLERREIKQKDAAVLLGLRPRQIRNLVARYREQGPQGLVSMAIGKPGNRKYPDDFKELVLGVVANKYHDFGPTLAAEYLYERDKIKIGTETLRLWLIANNMHKVKRKKRYRVHHPRERREHYGELIQIDGSYHDWFEGRADKCCVIGAVDDATSKIMQLWFCDAETTFDYFRMIDLYIDKHGKPFAFYSDKHNIFRVNMKEPTATEGQSQLERAAEQLDIKLIHANTPQAKGRIERLNRSLQNRLIKWLRIEKISSMEDANANITRFIEDYNNKFAQPPAKPQNYHLKIPDTINLNLILAKQYQRKISSNLSISFENKYLNIDAPGRGRRLSQAQVTICKNYLNEITILHKGLPLDYKIVDKNTNIKKPVDKKELPKILKVGKWIPPLTHPWKSGYKNKRPDHNNDKRI
jgi:transposase InsO family protein